MKRVMVVMGLFLGLLLGGCFDSSKPDKSSDSSQDKASVQMQKKDDAAGQ